MNRPEAAASAGPPGAPAERLASGTGFIDPASWYASLPVLYAAAAALITDSAGRVLLVKPNYRDLWSLPGGICEHGEPPHVACAREVEEELGLARPVGRLLVTGWTAPDGLRPNPVMHLIFDGGTLDEPAGIQLQREELDAYRFTAPGDFTAYLPPDIASRVDAAVSARLRGGTGYAPFPP